MKLYINYFNIEILPNIMKLFNEYYVNCKTYINIYSVEGIYEIDNLKTNKLISIDNDITFINNFYKDFELIVDTSYFNIEPVNQVNPNNISTKMKKCFFKINKKSNIKLIIEGEIIDDKKELNPLNDIDYNIIPYDIYFELPNDININDPLVKEELIVFLSLLN